MQVNERYLALFWYWIREREAVRLRKEQGDKHPWSADQIFNIYHFCNVRREDDRTTKEIRKYVVAATNDWSEGPVSEAGLPWIYTLARMFNQPMTVFRALYSIKEGKDWVAELKELRRHWAAANYKGATLFRPAYVVSTCGMSMDKIDYVADVVKHVAKLKVPCVGLQDAHNVLTSVNGLGSFMAGQVVADLRNDRYLAPLDDKEAKFWSSWGPGSKKGLNLIFGAGTSPSNYQTRMMHLFTLMPEDIKEMRIHGQDLQNCLCEFSKYIRHLDCLGGRNRYYEGK